MARIRTIKPEFPQSESMGRVSRDARLLFIELWTLCDDSGRTRAASRMLASLLFPYDDDAPALIDGWIDELDDEGCLVRYKAGDSTYIQICNWLNHQKIDKPSASKIPAFDEASRMFSKSLERSSVYQGVDQGPRTKDQGQETAEKKPRFNPADCVLPPSIDSEKWAEWIAYRKGRKLATSEATALKQIEFLADCAGKGIDAGKVIDDSIRQGWQGLFEPKQQQASKPGYQSIHEQRANTIAILTGKKSHERTIADERDITGESCRVAG